MPGFLIPSATADVHVRLGPPEVRLTLAESLRRLAALTTLAGLFSPDGPS